MFTFRPHHFLCTLAFQGKGYSPAFVENFTEICNKLKHPRRKKFLLKVTFQTDSICQPCPHRLGISCKSQAKILSLDQRHAQALDLKEGDQLTWNQAKHLIKQRVNLETFDQICQGCEWKELGVCADALRQLHNEI